jgi:hypothetical protein
MNALSETDFYSMVMHFALIICMETGLLRTVCGFLFLLLWDVIDAVCRTMHLWGNLGFVALQAGSLARGSVHREVLPRVKEGSKGPTLREGPQDLRREADEQMLDRRLKTVFLFVIATVISQLARLYIGEFELLDPSVSSLARFCSRLSSWQMSGAISCFLALQHLPRLPNQLFPLVVESWLVAVILTFTAPGLSAAFALTASFFLSLIGMIVWVLVMGLGFMSLLRSSPFSGSPILFLTVILPFVAAYDATDPRWPVLELWLAAPRLWQQLLWLRS